MATRWKTEAGEHSHDSAGAEVDDIQAETKRAWLHVGRL